MKFTFTRVRVNGNAGITKLYDFRINGKFIYSYSPEWDKRAIQDRPTPLLRVK